MTTDKPSIAELQRLCQEDDVNHDADLALAAPALLEIAATALALRTQERVAAKARYLVYSSINKNAVPSDANYAAAGAEDSKLALCCAAYEVALSKVRP